MPQNSGMRYILLSLLAIPTVLGSGYPELKKDTRTSGGRGNINPPTASQMAEIKCLATMVYGEARGESETGQVAVAYSAVNRAKGKKSLCSVVLAPYQYSIFNNNPALRAAALSPNVEPKQKNAIDEKSWRSAMNIADAVFRKTVEDPTKGSTHYLAPAVMKAKGFTYPKWSRQYTPVAVIDNHKFFKPFYPKKKTKAAIDTTVAAK